MAPEHGLEGHVVLPVAGEAGEVPDEYNLKGHILTSPFLAHPAFSLVIALGTTSASTKDDAKIRRFPSCASCVKGGANGLLKKSRGTLNKSGVL